MFFLLLPWPCQRYPNDSLCNASNIKPFKINVGVNSTKYIKLLGKNKHKEIACGYFYQKLKKK